ncbi:MAG: LLM class flavin-dependent oxidoreductase [Candidatus Binataceae bacterium]|nr:LLM class flavin-dependent oxidoreductase [Candidatus Binataceae bacterium]
MKFFTFDELTYPKLPEYGPEIKFTNRFCDPAVVSQAYADHLDEWAMCEDLGFEGVFVNEHHFTALNIQPACNIMAAAVIMRTKRMKVGVIGNVIPLRNPIRTAEEFAMLDCLSGGRFIAGIVRGVPQEYVSYNIDPFSSHARQREAYEIIQKCLTEELFDYEGQFWKVTNVSIWPKPIQRPLPFWMPAGSLESIEFAAQNHISGAQVFGPTLQFQENFDLYRKVAHEKFGWRPDYSSFVGARLIHVAETNDQAIAEVRDALYYFFRTLNRPVINPAPLPGHASDKSYLHRKRRDQDVPGPNTPFEQMRRDGFIVCGDPEWVTRYLEEDMRGAGYGNFLGMFHVGNLAHEKVVKSKRLFGQHVIPKLAHLNQDKPSAAKPAAAKAYEVRSETTKTSNGKLPLYQDFNHILGRDSAEVSRSFREEADGNRVTAGWEMKVPDWGLDGFPYEVILVGPSNEMRGSAVRLRITDAEDREAPADAEVTIEVLDPSGGNRQIAMRENYGRFAEIEDQHAPGAALNIGSRVVAPSKYTIRFTISVPGGGFKADPDAPGSFFEIECFKNWLNITA